MAATGGLITRENIEWNRAVSRTPINGTYCGYDIISMPPISSCGAPIWHAIRATRSLTLVCRLSNSPPRLTPRSSDGDVTGGYGAGDRALRLLRAHGLSIDPLISRHVGEHFPREASGLAVGDGVDEEVFR
jgi:hypothetical protein